MFSPRGHMPGGNVLLQARDALTDRRRQKGIVRRTGVCGADAGAIGSYTVQKIVGAIFARAFVFWHECRLCA